MFEKKNRKKPSWKKRPVEAKWPQQRLDTQEDFNALVRAKNIEKDLPRHQRAKTYAKEKLASRRRRGKEQGMIEHESNVID